MILDATYGPAAPADLVEELRALAEWATFAAPCRPRTQTNARQGGRTGRLAFCGLGWLTTNQALLRPLMGPGGSA